MRALVVDDEPRARQRLARLLAAMPGVEVVGEAPHGVAALEAIPRVQPDALFLDVQMPGLSGFEVLDALPEAQRPLVVFERTELCDQDIDTRYASIRRSEHDKVLYLRFVVRHVRHLTMNVQT